MKKILILSTFYYALCSTLQAGLTDYKIINKAKEAYEAKEYTKSIALLNDVDNTTPQKSMT